MILALVASALIGQVASNVATEVEFRSGRDRPDPSRAVRLDVVFQAPGGRSLRVPAFWAGGRTWKVRYASGELGVHRYRSECDDRADPALHGAEGRVEVVAYEGTNPLYRHGPIRVAGDRRHFEHADGTPFFWLGDTWWMGLCHRLRFPDEFVRLADDRVAKGFNVVQIVAGLYPDMPPFDPRGANEAGFPWEPDYARIRPEYFDAADRRLQALVDRGISPCIVGMWGYFLPWMGPEKAKEHWRYLIARYGSWPVTWCVAGEANLPWYLAKGFPFDDRGQVRGWTDVARHVRETDPFRRPLTIHPTAIGRHTSRHAIDDPALLDFDMLQTPHGQREAAVVTFKAVDESHAARPMMPVVDGEASYEWLMDRFPAEWTRAMFWLAMTGGAAGHTYGANGIWQCNRRGQPHGPSPTGGDYGVIAWDDAMNLPGSAQVGAGKRFLARFPWPGFEPHPDWVAWADPEPTIPAEKARWIWFPEGTPDRDAPVAARYFRASFDLPGDARVTRARLLVAADDRFTAWVNGREAGSGGGRRPDPLDVGGALREGPNVVAILARNVPAPVAENPAGLLAALEVDVEGGTPIRLATDARWRASRDEAEGWLRPGFDDRGWPLAAELGPLGMPPWGPIVARDPIPPRAVGVVDGARVYYMLEPRPVVLRGLAPGRGYRVLDFDPVAGTTAPETALTAGADGQARRDPPAFGHDWAFALIPGP